MICRNHTGKSALSAIPTTTLHNRRCRRHGMLWQSLSRTSTNSTFHDCKSVSNCTPVHPHESLNPARRQRACGYGGGGVPALATWAVLKGGRACGGSLVLIFWLRLSFPVQLCGLPMYCLKGSPFIPRSLGMLPGLPGLSPVRVLSPSQAGRMSLGESYRVGVTRTRIGGQTPSNCSLRGH